MHTAHVRYSHFPVGAALRGVDGEVYVGSNVENASYPQGQCAETSALGALVAAGQTRITEVAVTAGAHGVLPALRRAAASGSPSSRAPTRRSTWAARAAAG